MFARTDDWFLQIGHLIHGKAKQVYLSSFNDFKYLLLAKGFCLKLSTADNRISPAHIIRPFVSYVLYISNMFIQGTKPNKHFLQFGPLKIKVPKKVQINKSDKNIFIWVKQIPLQN